MAEESKEPKMADESKEPKKPETEEELDDLDLTAEQGESVTGGGTISPRSIASAPTSLS